MIASDGRVNPLVRTEERSAAAPAIECDHEEDECICHVPVDNTKPCYDTFKEVLSDLGTLQRKGLFVAVCGPSRCGKTSLINRCVALAKRTLAKAGAKSHVFRLENVGGTPGLTVDHRAVLVGQQLAKEANKAQHVFDPDQYTAPVGLGDRLPVLEQYMRAVSDAVLDDSVLIVLTPFAEQATEVAQYWSGTSKRLLIFTETTATRLPQVPLRSVGEARPLRLELGPLGREDAKKFARARIHVRGRRDNFPDLDLDAIDKFFGESPMVTIGMIQTFLYNLYASYLHNPWPDGRIIRMEDLQRFVRENPEG